MSLKKLLFSITLILCVIFLPLSALAEASTISVKLVNNIGNQSTVNLVTQGSYKLANGNIRLSGADRFEVANNVASSGWATADTVIVANYVAFADALAAAPLAYKHNAPILLTQPNQLTTATKTKIASLKPKKIIIVGGTGSVSANVASELQKLASSVTRISGKDRFEVAYNISRQLGNSSTAIITNGLVFADALSIAPYAARNGIPILLSTKDKLTAQTKSALNGKSKTLAIGGEGSISSTVYNQLPGRVRIGGKDRYEVAANIVRQLNLNASTAFVSTGTTFADALTGSVLAAKDNAPMLLTTPNNLPASIKSVIQERGTNSFTILGGTGSVSNSVVSALPNEVWLNQGTTYSVKAENSRLVLYQGTSKLKDFGNTSFTLVPSAYSSQNQIKLNGNVSYIGNMEFLIESGRYVRPINKDIPYEDYLKGVVPREMPASWEIEALKAQAVAARTYSIDDVGKTVDDTQGYQVYGGYTWGSGQAPYQYESRTNQAVEATKGEVLKYNGKLISAVYSSSNGGYTESNSNEWGSTQLPYLPAKTDPYDPQTPWSITLNKTQIDLSGKSLENPGWWWSSSVKEVDATYMNGLRNWLLSNGYSGSDIKIVSINDFAIAPDRTSGQRSLKATIDFDFFVKNSSGYVWEVNPATGKNEIKRHNMKKELPVSTFRSMFGTMNFKSRLLVDVSKADPNKLIINGKGFGHGVGMSQNGANVAARQGLNYKQILEFYYPSAVLTK